MSRAKHAIGDVRCVDENDYILYGHLPAEGVADAIAAWAGVHRDDVVVFSAVLAWAASVPGVNEYGDPCTMIYPSMKPCRGHWRCTLVDASIRPPHCTHRREGGHRGRHNLHRLYDNPEQWEFIWETQHTS